MAAIEEAGRGRVRVGERAEGFDQPVAVVQLRAAAEEVVVAVLRLGQPVARTGEPGVGDQPVVLAEADEDAGQDPGGGDLHHPVVSPGLVHGGGAFGFQGAVVLGAQGRHVILLRLRTAPEVVLQESNLLLQVLEQRGLIQRRNARTVFLRRHRRNLSIPDKLPWLHGVSLRPSCQLRAEHREPQVGRG